MKPRFRLRVLITALAVLTALLPTGFIGAFLYFDGLQAREAARERAAHQARLAAGQVEAILWAAEAEFGELLERAGQAPAAAPVPSDRFRAVELLSGAGALIASWTKPNHPPPERWWRTAPLDGAPGIATLLIGPPEETMPTLAWLGRVPGNPGRFLVAEVDPVPLLDTLTQLAGLASASLAVAAVGEPPGEDAARAVPASAPVGATGLQVLLRAAGEEDPTADVRRLWLAMAVGLLGAAPAVWLGKQVSEPTSRAVGLIAGAGRRAAEGDRGAQVAALPALACAELHDLAQDLNRLAQRIFAVQDELTEAKESLERSISARTEELAQRTIDLSNSRATLYAVMESMRDGLVLTAPDGRIRYINENAAAMLKLPEPLYPGRSVDRLYAVVARRCEGGDLSPEAIAAALVDPERSLLLTVSEEGSKRRYLRWRTFRIQSAVGTDLGLGHLLTDVTQEHEVDRVKSELISTVSHELRTPLTAIRASVSSLLRPGVEWDEETRHEFLTTILDESRRLQELIENLLDMSKIEAGVLQLDLDTASVERFLEGVAGRARTLYPDQTLSVLVPPGLPPVRIDARRMEQVMLNLIDNAVKYAGETPVIELEAQRRGREVWLMVRDHGKGIPAEHLDRIFERFHRVESPMTRHSGGSGLGLAISRGIVEGHGGRIWAESEPGMGSTFYVALPAVVEEESDEA